MTSLPPLLEPAAPLTDAEFARYSRHVLLPEVGELGQRRLKAARVFVVGAGGLGAPALQYLAAAGVGTLGIIDDDVVEESNLQRQVIHRTRDIGTSKVDSAARAIGELNPLVRVRTYPERLTAENAPEIFAEYDLIVDGADNFPTRYLVSDAAAAANMPVLWASVLGFDAQLALFWDRPPAGSGLTLRDLFPAPPAPGMVPSCSEAGVIGAMVGTVGSAVAAEAIKLIIGIGTAPLGTVLVFDQLRTTWTPLPLRRRTRPLGLATPGSGPAGGFPAREVPVTEVPPPRATGVDSTTEILTGYLLLDVRESAEVAGGTLPGAVHIPLARVLTEGGRSSLDPAIPILVYCRTGPRAERAARELTDCGFTAVVYAGGYTRWSQENTRPAAPSPTPLEALP